MDKQAMQEDWEREGKAVAEAVAHWRESHPKATLAEIEAVVDDQVNRFRARLIEGAAQASEAANALERLACEQCGRPLQARGRARRRWQTQGGQRVEVERAYVSCPQCGGGFFPPG